MDVPCTLTPLSATSFTPNFRSSFSCTDETSSKKPFNKNYRNISPKKNKQPKQNDVPIIKNANAQHEDEKSSLRSRILPLQQAINACPHSLYCGLCSYRVAEDNLREQYGISLSHMTIGELTANVADEMMQQENNPTHRTHFQHAQSDMFDVDETSVHTCNDDRSKQ